MKKKHIILPLSAVLKIILTNLFPAHFHFSFLPRFKRSLQGAATFGYSAETFVRVAKQMQLWKLIFKLTNVKFQCNLDRENVYRRRNDLSLSVLNKRFSLTMQLTKNPNARQNKLTNNHVSLRPREHIETGFLSVFYTRSCKNNAWKVSSGPVRFTTVDNVTKFFPK